jgi:hypothetical protein
LAYNFTAEARGEVVQSVVRQRLSRYTLIEYFPVEVSSDRLTIGISIPFRHVDDAKLEGELVDLMTFLIAEQGFEVTDLYEGTRVTHGQVPGLLRRISG